MVADDRFHNSRPALADPVGEPLLIPQEAVGFCAAADLGPPLAGAPRPGHDHQISVEVLQDLDLGRWGTRRSKASSRFPPWS
jgi:hypothetical protein